MSAKFEFDEGAFRRAVQRQINQGMRDLGAKAQRELDAVFRDHGGEPVEAIIPHLEAAMRRFAWKISRDDLTKSPKPWPRAPGSCSGWRTFACNFGAPPVRLTRFWRLLENIQ